MPLATIDMHAAPMNRRFPAAAYLFSPVPGQKSRKYIHGLPTFLRLPPHSIHGSVHNKLNQLISQDLITVRHHNALVHIFFSGSRKLEKISACLLHVQNGFSFSLLPLPVTSPQFLLSFCSRYWIFPLQLTQETRAP